MVRHFVISEINLAKFLILLCLGKKLQVLAIEPAIPYSKILLEKLVMILIKFGLTRWSVEEINNLKELSEDHNRTLLYDVFGDTEDFQNRFYEFSQAEKLLGPYVMPYKLIITKYYSLKHVSLLAIKELSLKSGTSQHKFFGLAADTISALSTFSPKTSSLKPAFMPNKTINLALSFLVFVVSCFWIVFHFRLKRSLPKEIFLGADYVNDSSDLMLYEELDDGGDMLMVRRGDGVSDSQQSNHQNGLKKNNRYTYCFKQDGVIYFSDIFFSFKMIFSDIIQLFIFAGRLHPLAYWSIVSLPYKKLIWQGLFRRFRPKFFWGRDPYSEDHIIRRQELNKVGGKSLAVNTGTLSWAILSPAWRYISYDKYYVFGKGVYTKNYRDTWAPDMKIIPAGTFRATRAHYSRRFEKKPNNIVVFISVYSSEAKVRDLVNELSNQFPKKIIYVQIKPSFRLTDAAIKIIDVCERLPNVIYSEDSVYDLFEKGEFCISDPSSVVNESIQFGMKTFALDFPNIQRSNPFREHPQIIIQSASEFINRVLAIEKNSWLYPVSTLKDLVDMSGIVFADRVRSDMGLEAKDKSPQPLINDLS